MNSFELIVKYLPKAVDKYFFEDAKTAVLEQGDKFIDVKFDQTGYVKIASILMDGLSNYYQTQEGLNPNSDPYLYQDYAAYAGNTAEGARDGFAIGGVSVDWEIFRLQYVRGRQFRIDYISDEETAGIIIGNAVEEFNRIKVVPEVDATRFSIIADKASASLGNLLSEDLSANQIIGKFNSAFEWLSEHEVPAEQQVIFVNPTVMTLIRNTTEITKFITQGDFRSNAGLDFTIEKYMGRPIIEVPTNRFFTNVLITNNGYRATTDSKIINYMIVSTKAVVPVRKLEWSKIYSPEQSGLVGFHGYLINYLLYHGVVIPRNKVVGTYVSVAATGNATAKVNTLAIDTVAGSTQYAWKLRNYYTNPAALRGYIVYDDSAFTLGATLTGTEGTDYKVATLNAENTEAAGSKSYYFALVDASKKIIAVSGSVAVTQRA